MRDFEYQGEYIYITRKVVQHGKVRIAGGAIQVLKQLGKYRESPKMKLNEMKGILEKHFYMDVVILVYSKISLRTKSY